MAMVPWWWPVTMENHINDDLHVFEGCLQLFITEGRLGFTSKYHTVYTTYESDLVTSSWTSVYLLQPCLHYFRLSCIHQSCIGNCRKSQGLRSVRNAWLLILTHIPSLQGSLSGNTCSIKFTETVLYVIHKDMSNLPKTLSQPCNLLPVYNHRPLPWWWMNSMIIHLVYHGMPIMMFNIRRDIVL